MHDEPRRKFIEIIATVSEPEMIEDPRRLEGLLRDLMGQYRREVSVLINAVREAVVEDLLEFNGGLSDSDLVDWIDQLSLRLQDQRGVTQMLALWAVESWAIACGVITEDMVSQYEDVIPETLTAHLPIDDAVERGEVTGKYVKDVGEEDSVYLPYPEPESIWFDSQPLGRANEEDYFLGWLRAIMGRGEPCKPGCSYIALISGEVGIGKTHLCDHLRWIAETDQRFEGMFKCLHVDWHSENDLMNEWRTNHGIVPLCSVLDSIERIFAASGFESHFKDYRKTSYRLQNLENNVKREFFEASADLLVGEDKPLVNEILKLVMALPLEVGISLLDGSSDLELSLSAVFWLLRAPKAVIDALRRKLTDAQSETQSKLNVDDIKLLKRPNDKLAESFAKGVQSAARGRRILISLDHYEVVDRVDMELRRVIKHTGSCVGWILCGRRNLASDQTRANKRHVGYSHDVPEDRLLTFKLAPLSAKVVKNYFDAPDRALTRTEERLMLEVTGGIPFIMYEVTEPWYKSVPLSAITGQRPHHPDRQTLVGKIIQRFMSDVSLPHREKIYILSLAYDLEDEPLLSSMLEVDSVKPIVDWLEELYGFSLLAQVKSLRTYLREHMQIPLACPVAVRTSNERAISALVERRRMREIRLQTLEQRINDLRWAEATLGLIHHTFWKSYWQDDTSGWDLVLMVLAPGLVYAPNYARKLIEVAVPFAHGKEEHEYKMIKRGMKGLAADKPGTASATEARKLIDAIESMHKYAISIGIGMGGDQGERQALLGFLRGTLEARSGDNAEARKLYAEALKYCPQECHTLRRLITQKRDDLPKPITRKSSRGKTVIEEAEPS